MSLKSYLNLYFYSIPMKYIINPFPKSLVHLAAELEKPYSPAILTTLDRDEWQGCRTDFFSYGINNVSIKEVEHAVCFVGSNLNPFFHSNPPLPKTGYKMNPLNVNIEIHFLGLFFSFLLRCLEHYM